jgi:hypothetical protein
MFDKRNDGVTGQNQGGKNPPKIEKIKDYKNSIMYRIIEDDFENKNFRSILKEMESMSKNPLMNQKHASMMDVLIQAYEGGDHSDKLIEQLKKTVDEYFQELVDKGLIHQQKMTIDSIDSPEGQG